MIRFTKALALAATLLALPSMASALGIEIVNVFGDGAGGTLPLGGTVSFELRVTYDGTEPSLYGLSADMTGMDLPDPEGTRDFGLALAGGGSVSEMLGIDVFGDGSFISDSMSNNNGNVPVERFVTNQLNPQPITVNMFEGIDLGGPGGDGSGDYGLLGGLVIEGDYHFLVTLQNVFPASATPAVADLQFSVLGLDQNGVAVASTGDSFSLVVVPEPGTALLMGLGLAGLATVRRS